MKQLVMALLIALPLSLVAQPDKNDQEKLTIEQRAVLQAKTIRLKLELTASQESKIKKVLQAQMEAAKAHREKVEKEGLSEYERKLHFLDTRFALNEQMKAILTNDQYEKWKKAGDHMGRQRKMAMRKRKGMNKEHHRPERKW